MVSLSYPWKQVEHPHLPLEKARPETEQQGRAGVSCLQSHPWKPGRGLGRQGAPCLSPPLCSAVPLSGAPFPQGGSVFSWLGADGARSEHKRV